MTLKYLPEGALLNLPRNKAFIGSRKGLESAQKLGEILEAVALSCDNDLNLTVRLGEGLVGVIPRREATLPLPDRTTAPASFSPAGRPRRTVLRTISGTCFRDKFSRSE